jgi:hypothetical protein
MRSRRPAWCCSQNVVSPLGYHTFNAKADLNPIPSRPFLVQIRSYSACACGIYVRRFYRRTLFAELDLGGEPELGSGVGRTTCCADLITI